MTPEQIRAIKMLSRCTFLPASFDKRFVRSMVDKANDPEPTPLTPKQDALLWRMVHRYRRQHGKCTCLECFREKNKGVNPYQ